MHDFAKLCLAWVLVCVTFPGQTSRHMGAGPFERWVLDSQCLLLLQKIDFAENVPGPNSRPRARKISRALCGHRPSPGSSLVWVCKNPGTWASGPLRDGCWIRSASFFAKNRFCNCKKCAGPRFKGAQHFPGAMRPPAEPRDAHVVSVCVCKKPSTWAPGPLRAVCSIHSACNGTVCHAFFVLKSVFGFGFGFTEHCIWQELNRPCTPQKMHMALSP